MFKLGAFTRPKEKPRRYARGRLTAFEAERPGRLQFDDQLERDAQQVVQALCRHAVRVGELLYRGWPR
jgi:hypothetical protein